MALQKLKEKKPWKVGSLGINSKTSFASGRGKKSPLNFPSTLIVNFPGHLKKKKTNVPQIFPHFILLETIGIASHA